MKCACKHVRNCPFRGDPLNILDLRGFPVFRALTQEELDAGIVLARDGETLRTPPLGAYVGTDGKGTVVLMAMPIDPNGAVAYMSALGGTRCRADSALWRRAYPGPPKEQP